MRMKALILAADRLIDEMTWLFALEQGSVGYRAVKTYLSAFRWLLYGMSVMLNLVLLEDHRAEEHPHNPFRGVRGMPTYDVISIVLCVLLAAGYLVILAFSAVTDIPLR